MAISYLAEKLSKIRTEKCPLDLARGLVRGFSVEWPDSDEPNKWEHEKVRQQIQTSLFRKLDFKMEKEVAKEDLRLRENIYVVENALNLYRSERTIKEEMVEATGGDGVTITARSLRRNRDLRNIVSVSSMKTGIVSIL